MLSAIKDKLKIGSRDERKDPLPLPNGLLALSSSHDGLLRAWDERGRCALTLAGHEKAVYTVINLPDGRVASGGYDNSVRIWNLRTARCETALRGHSDSIFCLRVFFIDRDAALAAAAASINHSTSGGERRVTPAFKIVSSSSDKAIKIWNGVTYKCEQTLAGHTGSILSMVQLSDTLLATGSLDKTIRVWNIEKNRCELTMSGHLSSVSGLAVLDDNTKIASCSYDETIKIWQIYVPPGGGTESDMPHFSLEKSIRGHTSAIMNILHLPATSLLPQRLVTCSRDLNIKVWALPVDGVGGIGHLRCISNITSHRNDINNLCVLSDMRTLVSCSSDCMIKTFDLEKTGNINTSELSITNTNQDGKGYTVYSVCPLPDSRRTLLRKALQNVAVEEWEETPHPLNGYNGSAMRPQAKLPTPRAAAMSLPPPSLEASADPYSQALVPRPVHRTSSQEKIDGMIMTTPSTAPVAASAPGENSPGVLSASLSDSDVDEDERSAKPLILKPDHELDPSLCRIIQKYRLRHYLAYGDLMDDGFYDDGGVVFVTTSHVAKSAPRPAPPQIKPPPPKISLNNRLSYASPAPATPQQQQPQQPESPSSSSLPLPSPDNSPGGATATGAPPVFRPYKQWTEETIVFDARFDQVLRSTTEDAKRLLAGVSDLKARIMLLALFVSNKLGGGPKDIVKEWQSTITKLRKVYGRQTTGASGSSTSASSSRRLVLPIGSLIGRVGLSRHRALLFKYLCDQTVLFPENWAPPLPQEQPAPLQNSPRVSPLPGATPSPHHAQIASIGALPPAAHLSYGIESIGYTTDSGNTNGNAGQEEKTMGMHTAMTPLHSPNAASAATPIVEGEDAEVERTNAERSPSSSSVEQEDPLVSNSSSHSPHRPRMTSGESVPANAPPLLVYPSIHARLMRGQYEYHFPRSALRAGKTRQGRMQRTWEESWEDQEAGYSRHQDAAGSSKTFHAWVAVELAGSHYVVDLSYEPSQLYLESSKEAAHYNRGRLGDVKKTGLTAAPLRSLHEVKWHELTDLVLLRDGGFGRVEKAKYRGLEVVVKTPLSLDSYILKTFSEEAVVLNLLSHPNIVKLVGVCTEKKAIVLDFVQGGDLHTFIKTQAALAQQYQQQLKQHSQLQTTTAIPYTPLTMFDRLDMCIQIAIGMQYLHLSEPMITHRDLKTLNLLVSTVRYHPDELSPSPSPSHLRRGGFVQKRVIKVCDFGLARNQHHDDGISTQHKDVGTPAFQSPEQWRDDEEERLTTATDVYSFGGIMMEILTDRMPWCNEKCWGAGATLMLFDGRVKAVEDIVRDHHAGIKQQLMGDDNTPRTIRSATQGHTAQDEQRWVEAAAVPSSSLPRPGMYRIDSRHLGRNSFTCNGDHVLVARFLQGPSSVKSHSDAAFTFDVLVVEDGENANTPTEPNSWRGGVAVMRSLSFTTQAEADEARAQADAAWEPLVWECTVDQFRLCSKSIQQLARMYQPDLVQFAPPASSLRDSLEAALGHPTTSELVLSTAWTLGAWLTNNVAVDVQPFLLGLNKLRPSSNLPAINESVLLTLLESYSLRSNAAVPLDLLRESQEVRLSLLAGILDSAAHYSVASGLYFVPTSDRPFADSLLHLSRGLGFTTDADSSSAAVTIGGVSLSSIPTEIASQVAKSLTSRESLWSQHCHGFEVTPLEHAAYYGLTLDQNERCLLGDFVVTHNSKYAIYQHVMVDKHLPPIPADAQLHPKLIELIDACHQFEPAARPAFPDVLRVLREVSDEIEEEQNQRAHQLRASSPFLQLPK